MGICTRIYQINKASVCASVMIYSGHGYLANQYGLRIRPENWAKYRCTMHKDFSFRSLYGNGYELDHFEQKKIAYFGQQRSFRMRPDQKLRIHYTVPARLILQEVP